MKKLIVSGLLALGLAFAQGRVFVEAFGGELSIVPSFGLAAGISAGKTKMVGPMDLRGSVNVFAGGGGASFSVESDILYPLSLAGAPRMDVGLGLGVGVGSAGGSSATNAYLRALVAMELPLQADLAVRVEPTLTFGQQTTFGVRIGPRVYLR